MSCKKSFLVLTAVFICMLMASAGVNAVEVEQDDYDNLDIVNGIDSLTVTLTDCNESLRYKVYGYIGIPDEDGSSIIGEVFLDDVAGNGSYTFSFDSDALNIEGVLYTVYIAAYGYNTTDFSFLPEEHDNESVYVSKGIMASGSERWLVLYDHTPIKDSDTLTAHDSGTSVQAFYFTYNTTDNTGELSDIDLLVKMADMAVHSEGYLYPASFAHSDIPLVGSYETYLTTDIPGFETMSYGVDPYEITTSKSNYEYNKTGGYVIFYGINKDDVTGDVSVYTDDTMMSSLWGMNDIEHVNWRIGYDWSRTYDFYGGYCNFGVSPMVTGGFEFTPGDIGEYIQDYGDSIGLPFFSIFFILLIIGVSASVPFSISVKYGINFPNLVYVFSISVGVVLCWGIGILATWATVFYFAILIAIALYQNKEFVRSLVADERRHRVALKSLDVSRRTLGERKKLTSGVTGYLKPIKEQESFPYPAKGRPDGIFPSDYSTHMMEDEDGNKMYAWVNQEKDKALIALLKSKDIIERDTTPRGTPRKEYSESYEKEMARKGYKKEGKYWVKKSRGDFSG